MVYPAQGVGIIERTERQELGGCATDFYIVRIINNNIVVMVPVKNAVNAGLRCLSSKKEANEALAAQIKDATAEMQVLRAANTRLQQIEKLGFWGRLVWSLKGKV